MTLSALSDGLVAMLCLALLVQTSRLSLLVRRLRREELGAMVRTIDAALAATQSAMAELRGALATEASAQAEAIARAAPLRDELTMLRDELSVMVGVGNGIAERLVAAAEAARTARPASPEAVAPDDDADARPPARTARSRRRRSKPAAAVPDAGAAEGRAAVPRVSETPQPYRPPVKIRPAETIRTAAIDAAPPHAAEPERHDATIIPFLGASA
ncbi:hypothetical protein [Sphingomonas morindae]|uniref:Uncharacterized protein n=1 Tax=Sphingomonas morindae TaxID=1541170 RepID=A0ABY4X567_9SPHN|nr:hypothetical protein [Sphingomonas morindae]USI71985.1 hypothetical protein LHA26_11765 [Sphingomonas morindae]